MAVKTYKVGLRGVLKLVYRYITKWQQQLQDNMTEGQYTCLIAVLTAVTECLTSLGEPEIGS
jgi:hypothetical protein